MYVFLEYTRTITATIAIITNILIVATLGLSFKFWRYNIGILLLTLACVDIIGNGTYLIHDIIVFKIHYDLNYHSRIILMYVNNSFKLLSRLMMILISVNRYALICKPFNHQIVTSRKSVIMQSTALALMPLTGNAICMFLRRKMCTWTGNLISIAVPIVITLIMTILVVREIKKNSRTLGDSVGSDAAPRQGERNVTRAMIATNVVFIVLALPDGILNFLCQLKYFKSCFVISKFLLALSEINFSINIFIYTLYLPKFRSTLFRIFTYKYCKKIRGYNLIHSNVNGI